MVHTDAGTKFCKLIMVTENNNNKFYDMVENPDGSFSCTWGRVDLTSTVTHYPASKGFEKVRQSKIKKGYKDVTDFRVLTASKVDFATLGTDAIAQIVEELQRYANASVSSNYSISSDAVTQKQVDEAQRIIDDLIPLIKMGANTRKINESLLDLYQVIPRKMYHVQDHLVRVDAIQTLGDEKDVDRLIADEQATLDVMKGQVHVATVQKDQTQDDKKTILDALGIEIFQTTPDDVKIIKKQLGGCKSQYRRSFKVVNKKTQTAFDKHVEKSTNKSRQLLWHGSRNENWWSIISSGLIIRPSNVVLTGSMYGSGVYGSSFAKKSIGYSSVKGSYWARGNSSVGFIGIYDFHIGKQLIVDKHGSWCYQLSTNLLKKKGDYDSVYAPAGYDLRNPETIVYDIRKTTIKYLVKIEG